MSRFTRGGSLISILSGFGWPLIVGLAACSSFYVLVFEGPLNTPIMHRYFATHPVSYFEVAMFFVGLAALVFKLTNVLGQYGGLRHLQLDTPETGDTRHAAEVLMDQVEQAPRSAQTSYLGQRLTQALDHVHRRGAAIGLDEELKYLADSDSVRQQESYGLVRIIIWATPMLGFLGTVIGITQALGDLDPEELATSVQTAMEGLLAGLYVAFDTTAVALSLSILLMFIQFFADRLETNLLTTVDERVAADLLGCFDRDGRGSDPHLIAVDRISVAVARTTERLIEEQTGVWRQTIDHSNEQWRKMLSTSGQLFQQALTESLDATLSDHAERLAELGKEADDRVLRRWDQWQSALSQNAELLKGQQQEMIKQGEIMTQVVKATGDVVSLEKALNDNLNALSGAKNFEETVMSLSAAIHLLNSRVDRSGERHVDLSQSPEQDRAA